MKLFKSCRHEEFFYVLCISRISRFLYGFLIKLKACENRQPKYRYFVLDITETLKLDRI